MKKNFFKILLVLLIIIFSLIAYLSLIGIETDKFNNQIEKKIKNFSNEIKVELKKIKIVLDPFNFQFNTKTLGTKIKSGNQVLEIESIQTQISLNSIFNESFVLKNLDVSTKSIEIRQFISFIRSINRDPKLLILENFIKKGYLIADIKLEFDENGNIKDNYNIRGFIKNGKIDFLKKYKFEKINFNFDIKKDQNKFQDVNFSFKDLNLNFETLTTQNIYNEIIINGKSDNKNLIIKESFIKEFININILKIEKIDFDAENVFSFKINKKLRFKDLKLKSKIKLNEASFADNFNLEVFFPKIKNQLKLLNHHLNIDYNKDEFKINGSGDLMIQNNSDTIYYSFLKKGKKLSFDTSIDIRNNEMIIDFLNYKKNIEKNLNINIKGSKDQNNLIKLDLFNIKNDQDKIELNNIIFDKDFKIDKLQNAKFDYLDKEDQLNKFKIVNKKNKYVLTGNLLNANHLLEKLIESSNDKKLEIFKKKINLEIQIENIYLDKEYNIEDLQGNLTFFNDSITNANLKAFFPKKGEIKFTVNSKNDEIITTLFSDQARPFVKRYKFIKGFNDGSLDFYSLKKGDKSSSNLKIYDFKLKEVPALTKLLTLASLQGIADLLSGEGIRFNEFEMQFENKGSLMTINEIYGIGPAISILMDGYVEKNKLVSLRGTLVPATTINKVIGSIPILGKILVGSKTGEGVFGVSFKIKGPPKKLETTVNPIKTLTPRFITRTLEKIKKLN